MATLTTFALSADNDIDISNGTTSLVSDAAAIKQQNRVELQYWKGNFFLNLAEGMDRTIVFGKKEVDVELESEFKIAGSNATGIASLENLTLVKTEKTLNVTMISKTVLVGEENVITELSL